MTVEKLIEELKQMPKDALVTNEYGYVVDYVCCEPKESEEGYWVWLQFSTTQTD